MQKWQYCLVFVAAASKGGEGKEPETSEIIIRKGRFGPENIKPATGKLMDVLADLGNEGWEAVSFHVAIGGHMSALFKKPL